MTACSNKRPLESPTKPSLKRQFTQNSTSPVPDTPIATLISLTTHYDTHITLTSNITIGRSSKCDIKLSSSLTEVSSVHCTLIARREADRWVINLLDNSTNGTLLKPAGAEQCHRVPKSGVVLRQGDELWIGKAGFMVKYFEDPDVRRFSDLYVIGRQLGSGHYATVSDATSKESGSEFAVKVFKPQRANDAKSATKFQQEMDVLKSLRHPNVVGLVDAFVEPISQGMVSTYLVLEKVTGGELFTRIVERTQLPELEAKGIFKQLLEGLKYLHGLNIIHRDIKPENILLNSNNNGQLEVKIADFGLAKFIGELHFTNTLCGTPSYVAPEVLHPSSERQYAKPVDMWSAGVLLYVCIGGFPPFSDELGPPSMREQVLLAKYAFYSPYFDAVSDTALDLISNLLVREPHRRHTVDQALAHPWLCLKDNPERANVHSSQFHERSDLGELLPRTYTEMAKSK